MDPVTTLGTILETEASRDAIHIAIAPVVASRTLRPGDRVGLNEKGEADNLTDNDIGVVDPYLKSPVRPGQRFWLFLFPGTITGLRHQWAHPAFGPLDASKISHDDHVSKSKAWIAQHANDMGLSDDVLMENAASWLADKSSWPDYNVQQGSERWRDTFNADEFWHHYEVVTGTVVPADKKASMYCCSC